MRSGNDMEELLRRQRRRQGRLRRWMRGAGVLAVVAAAVYWGTGFYERRQDDGMSEGTLALQQASAVVDRTVGAARRPLEVERKREDERTPDEALTATWNEGEPCRMRGELADDQSVFQAMRERNVPPRTIQKVVSATSQEFDFRNSRPGDEWSAEVDADGAITRFRYQTSPEDIWETVRNSNGSYSCSKIDVPVERRPTTIAGVVDASLWKSMVDAGAKGALVERFANIFAYSVDFHRETKPGDRFAMVVEKVFVDGEFLRFGRIRAAEYVNRGKRFRGYRYPPGEKEASYFDGAGKNLKRQFLKSPIASMRVTSDFGMRYHPVLGQQKMHRGVDYGAPRGTAVRAVADGTVTFAGRKGANGNLVVLRHANGYTTLYAHLSEISDGVRPGRKVAKKKVIGEVGSTGRSTGPHLHYGMKQHGEYVNPQEIDTERAEPLKGDELKRFKEEVVPPLAERLEAASSEGTAASPTDIAQRERGRGSR